MRRGLTGAGYQIDEASLVRVANNPMVVEDRAAAAVLRLMDALEELDDVRQVETNLELSDELVASFAAS